ncbi:MAG: hypothetical protein ACRDL3_05325 [Solirubrobacterales bacterium]
MPRWLTALVLASLLAAALAAAPRADALVYWANANGDAIGRANLNGSGVDQSFIGQFGVFGVAANATHLYWSSYDIFSDVGAIGRAGLDGSGVNGSLIETGPGDLGQVAVAGEHLYWAHSASGTIGRASLDGTGANPAFITGLFDPRGVAVSSTHIYWTSGSGNQIGRANLNGSGVNHGFISHGGGASWGVDVDGSHVYWGDFEGTIGRANLNGSGANPSFITGASTPTGVAVDAAHVYWSNAGADAIGRANLDGSGRDQSFIDGAAFPLGIDVDARQVAPPSNEFSFGKVKRNKRKGTAKLTVIVPGPGELDLAKNRKVKPNGKRADTEGSVKLPIKPKGKGRKKLKRKGAAKVKAEVTYTPDGGSANIQSRKVKLRKRG